MFDVPWKKNLGLHRWRKEEKAGNWSSTLDFRHGRDQMLWRVCRPELQGRATVQRPEECRLQNISTQERNLSIKHHDITETKTNLVLHCLAEICLSY